MRATERGDEGTNMKPGWWTVKESADYARVGTAVIYRECSEGRLKHGRIGGRRDIRIKGPDAVDAWLAERWRSDPEPSAAPQDTPALARSFPRDTAKAG